MAEQLQNATAAPDTTTTEAVTAGTTTDFDVTDGSVFPATGNFRIVVRGTNDDGSDDALGTVASRTGNNLASITWIDNGQTTFASGAGVDVVLSAEGLDAAIDDRVATHEALTTAHASATNLIHTTGAETKAGNLTLSDRLLHQNGSAAAPAIAPSARSTDGFYSPANNQIGVATNGVLRAAITNSGLASFFPLALYTGLWQQTQNIGASLNVNSSSTPSVLILTQASCTLNMPQVTWSTFPIEFVIADILGVLTSLTINGWNDGAFEFNDFNGASGTYGAWTDGLGFSVGPYGAAPILTDTEAFWRMASSKNDTGSGASGGWTIQKFATDLAY